MVYIQSSTLKASLYIPFLLVYSGKSALVLYNVFMQDTLKKEHRKKHKNKEMAETHLYTIRLLP
jgi:hypothetical protein